MTRSMTGYGRASNNINNREITVEIKSVNHRYFDAYIRAPRVYGFLDEAVKKFLSKNIARGKLEVYISVDNSKTGEAAISLNKEVLEAYLAVLNQIKDEYSVKDDISVMTLARNSDIFSTLKDEPDAEQITNDVIEVVSLALDKYNSMREIEGEKLKEDILLRLNIIEKIVTEVEVRSPKCVVEYQAKLFAKLTDVLENSNIDEQRILTEAAIFADKVAVTEEVVRLRSHISQLRTILNTKGGIGKKLDFLIQEFNREANTIGSKANDFEIATMVVELKAEIEKIREQIQNLE